MAGYEGKVAFVTGAAMGFGYAFSEALLAHGASVAVVDIDKAACEAAAKRLGKAAIPVVCDVADETSVDTAVQETIQAFGGIDLLINNAGLHSAAYNKGFRELGIAGTRRLFDVNVMGVINCTLACRESMSQRGGGAILNIASIAGLGPLTHSVAYCNGKAATVSFTQWLAVHMAQEYSPAIRVNALAPGFCLTTQNRFLLVDEATGRPTLRCERALAQTPMRRLGRPEEMVGAALWLLSDAASFVTGVVVPVDGGFSAYSGV